MTEFVVRLDHRPGTLAGVTEVLANAGVNIESLAAWGADGEGIVRFVVDNADATRRALRQAGLRTEERRVLVTSIPNRPGELANVTRVLADAEINIEALYLLRTRDDEVVIAIAVDDPAAAEPRLPVRGRIDHT